MEFGNTGALICSHFQQYFTHLPDREPPFGDVINNISNIIANGRPVAASSAGID